jgi:Tfp pilus assembly protein PilF
VYTIDERLKGLPAVKEQVVQLYQSLNQPHLAVPGRSAGPATAYVLGLRGPSGFAVFVYLYLSDSGECAVYVPTSGTVPADRYQSEEAEALGFVESMGFIMDNLNFRGRPPDEQETFIRTAPVFQREPPPPSAVPGVPLGAAGTKPPTGQKNAVVNIGKLFSAFCLALVVSGCAHWVSQENRDKATTHYELAVGLIARNAQQSYVEIEKALELNPLYAEAWHVKGILLHHSFGKLEEAKAAYEKARELKQPFSEAATNLGNLFMDLKRYDEAIALYDQALNDVLYGAPFIAHGNMGWAYYKKGDSKNALEHLKASVTINPKYCLGYSQLGQLYGDQGQEEESCKNYGRYRDACPDAPDAYHKTGLCLMRAGKKDEAQKAFTTCVEKATNLDLKDLCLKLKEQA